MKLLAFACFIILTTASCYQHETVFERMETKFKKNEPAINTLINMLNDPKADSSFGEDAICKKANEFNLNISQKLNSLDLRNVCRHYGNCRPYQKILIFETAWIPQDSVSIVYNICDTIETKKGYYKKDENSNEIWGIGNSWQIIKIVKYLKQKQ